MRLLLPAVLLLIAGGATAAEDALAAIRARAAQVATLRVPFTQEKRLAILDQPLRAEGVLDIDRRGKAVRLEFTGRSVVVLKGAKIRRWGADGREENTGDDPGLAAIAGHLQGLLDGDLSGLENVFRVERVGAAEGRPGCTEVVLLPRTPDLGRFVERLELVLREADAAPVRLLLVATGGDETDYRFAAPVPGGVPSPGRFDGP